MYEKLITLSMTTRLGCGGTFQKSMYCKLFTKRGVERVFKIGQYLAKMWKWDFFGTQCRSEPTKSPIVLDREDRQTPSKYNLLYVHALQRDSQWVLCLTDTTYNTAIRLKCIRRCTYHIHSSHWLTMKSTKWHYHLYSTVDLFMDCRPRSFSWR